MSKIEMVKRLDSSQPQLQIVAAVRDLQSEIAALRQDLMKLPRLHQQITQALDRILAIQQQALDETTSQALDRILAIQRQALDETILYMTKKATESIEQKTSKLDQTMRLVVTLPDALTSAQREMKATAETLVAATETVRRWLWVQAAIVIVAVLSVGATIGFYASKSQAPADVLQKAAWADMVLSKATERERALLKQIAARPEPSTRQPTSKAAASR